MRRFGRGPGRVLPVVAATMVAFAAAGCAEPEDQAAYCTVSDQGEYRVVDDDCERDDNSHHVVIISSPSTTYHVGDRIPANVVKDAVKFRANNTSARSKYGVSGNVRNGTVVRGGFGGNGGGKGAGG